MIYNLVKFCFGTWWDYQDKKCRQEVRQKIQVEVFWVVMLRSVTAEHHFEGPWCLYLHGPLKCWYPTTTLYGTNNSEDFNLNLHHCESLKILHRLEDGF